MMIAVRCIDAFKCFATIAASVHVYIKRIHYIFIFWIGIYFIEVPCTLAHIGIGTFKSPGFTAIITSEQPSL